MELIGRITANASIASVKDGRQVVNFTVAVNDRYKPKGTEETKKLTTFFNCSYWVNPAIAERLSKGSIVELYGRLSANAWINAEGEARASLNFHVSQIKFHGGGKPRSTENSGAVPPAMEEAPF